MTKNYGDSMDLSGLYEGLGGGVYGFITDVKSEAGAAQIPTQGGGVYQVRIPSIHGYCDVNEQNCEADVTKKDSLPWIPTLQQNGVFYEKGTEVLVVFQGPNYTSPYIASKYIAKHPIFSGPNNGWQGQGYLLETTVAPNPKNPDFKSTDAPDNDCYKIATPSASSPTNGTNLKNAKKCGESDLGNSITSVIGDFLMIVEQTDGKIGDKFVNSLTGELFSITNYVSQYASSISGIIRNGIGWVKAILSKYAKQAIDALVKKIMIPVQGILSQVKPYFDEILKGIFCSFGNIEGMISNMIKDLLNGLIDSTINSVMGCLSSLVDGIINEVMSEVLSIMDDVTSSLSAILGSIGDVANMMGEAVSSILNFLGISCSGSGDCSTAASRSLVKAFNDPGGYGLTTGMKNTLNSGLKAISDADSSITKSTSELNSEAAEFAKGVELGTAKTPEFLTNNEQLLNAFTQAESIIGTTVSNFCDSISGAIGLTDPDLTDPPSISETEDPPSSTGDDDDGDDDDLDDDGDDDTDDTDDDDNNIKDEAKIGYPDKIKLEQSGSGYGTEVYKDIKTSGGTGRGLRLNARSINDVIVGGSINQRGNDKYTKGDRVVLSTGNQNATFIITRVVSTLPGVPPKGPDGKVDDDNKKPRTDGPPYTSTTTIGCFVGKKKDEDNCIYTIHPLKEAVRTGKTQKVKIRRTNPKNNGIIILAVHLTKYDTARVVGITPGVNDGGDLERGDRLGPKAYITHPDPQGTTPELPIRKNVVFSKKIFFQAGEKSLIIDIPTLKNKKPDKKPRHEVTYTVSLHRCRDDLNTKKYPGWNLPTLSGFLNRRQLAIRFSMPNGTERPEPPPNSIEPDPYIDPNDNVADPEDHIDKTKTSDPYPGEMSVKEKGIEYQVDNISVDAGDNADFLITRVPADAEQSKVKVTTVDGTATDGTHYTGGSAVVDFPKGTAKASFSVKTSSTVSGVTSGTRDFSIKVVDHTLPVGKKSNLGGEGKSLGTTASGSTTVGSGITAEAVISYGTTVKPSAVCPVILEITEQPPSSVVHADGEKYTLATNAKATVSGYTIDYQWQRTYQPNDQESWVNVADGTRTQDVDIKVTTFGATDISYTVSGVTTTVSGWNTETVTSGATVNYLGASTRELIFNPMDYYVNDREYYRCFIEATPAAVSKYTPTLSGYTNNTFISVTKDNVISSITDGVPVLTSGVSIVYSGGTAPTTSAGGISSDSGQCKTYTPTRVLPEDVPDTAVVVEIPTAPEEEDDTPVNTDGERIIPEDGSEPEIISTPVEVSDNGGVVSVPIPKNLPRYQYPPLIPISGLGFGAVAKTDIDSDGNVIKVVVESSGIGYVPSKSGRCGILESIELVRPGGFYESAPTVYVNNDPTIATSVINADGRVVGIRITNPQNKVYTSIPRIDIMEGGGIGAAAVAVMKYVRCSDVADWYENIVNKYNQDALGVVSYVDCP